MNERIHLILDALRHTTSATDYSSIGLFDGLAGAAVFQLQYAKHFQSEIAFTTLAQQVEQIIATPLEPQQRSLGTGEAGIKWLLKYCYQHNLVSRDDLEDVLSNDNELAAYSLVQLERGAYDFIYGATGIAHYFLYEPITAPADYFGSFFSILLQQLQADGKDHYLPAYDLVQKKRMPGTVNLGAAHGMPSIIKLCVDCYRKDLHREKARSIGVSLMHFILNHLNPATFFSALPHSIQLAAPACSESRLAWCYGDLGTGFILLQAAATWNDPVAYETVLQILQQAAARCDEPQTMVRDASFCHGSAGNMHLFRKLYQQTQLPVFATASEYWFQRTLVYAGENAQSPSYQYYAASEGIYKNDHSLVTGTAGIGLVLLDQLSNDPAWDYCFQVNN